MLSFFCFYFIAITQGNFFTWVPSVQSLFEAMTWLLSLNDSKKNVLFNYNTIKR